MAIYEKFHKLNSLKGGISLWNVTICTMSQSPQFIPIYREGIRGFNKEPLSFPIADCIEF